MEVGKNTGYKCCTGKIKTVTDFPKERLTLSSLVNYHMQNSVNSPPSFTLTYTDMQSHEITVLFPPQSIKGRAHQLTNSWIVPSLWDSAAQLLQHCIKARQQMSLSKALSSKEIHHQAHCSAVSLPISSTCALLVWPQSWTSTWKVHITVDVNMKQKHTLPNSTWTITEFMKCHCWDKIYVSIHKPCKILLVLFISRKKRIQNQQPVSNKLRIRHSLKPESNGRYYPQKVYQLQFHLKKINK